MKFCVAAFSIFISSLVTVQSSAQSKAEKKLMDQLKADIEYLASDELEGRRTGTEGERKAGEYLVKRYKEIGIFPYGDMYRYNFKFSGDKEPTNSSLIRVGNKVLQINKDGFPMAFTGTKRAYSEVLPDIMEQDNVWLVPLYKDEEEANDPHFDWEKAAYEKTNALAKQSASGVIFYDNYNSKYPPVFNGKSEYEPTEIAAAFINYNAYQEYLKPAIAATSSDSAATGMPVELNVAIKKIERFGNNIAAYIDNKAPYTVVLGAHYDHLGYGEDGNSLHAAKDRQIHNGADDNASGTAALLAMADMIKKAGLKTYNYMFIHFSGEELGLYGSKAIVKDLGLDSTKIAYMVNMDMVGRLNDSTHALTVGGVGTSPAWGEFLAKPNKNFKIAIDSSGVGPSDHTSFYYANVPVLFFFTGLHTDYHKPSDDADKINYPGEVQVINYIYSLVSVMEKSSKPAFTTTKQNAVGKVRFKVTLGIMPDYTYQDGGVRADGVTEGRPAAIAGIKGGDIILQLGEYKILGMQSYMEALSKFAAGDKTTVVIRRGDKEMTLPIEFTPAK